MSVIHSTETPQLSVRLLVGPVLLGLVFLVFLFRLWDLQIARYQEYKRIVERSGVVRDSHLAPRGLIVDRNGAKVASVEPTYVLYLDPDQVADTANRGLLDRLADVLSIQPDEIYRAYLADNHNQFVTVASDLSAKQQKELKKYAKRLVGVTTDDQGRVLVDRLAMALPKNRGLFFNLSERAEISPADLVEAYTRNHREHRLITPVAFDLTPEQAAKVSETDAGMPGVSVQVREMRKYADSASLSHLLGYVGSTRNAELAKALQAKGREVDDYTGISGIEKQYDEQLSGRSGQISWRADAKGRKASLINDQEPVPGDKLTLSIDLELQRYANKLLGQRIGSFVAMDIHSGDILTMASTPGFDLRAYWGGDDEALADLDEKMPLSPLVFRAMSSKKAPGSTFKVVTTLAAALAHKFRPGLTLTCPGYYQMQDGRKLRCENHVPGAALDFHSALAKSCNRYFATMAASLSNEELTHAYEVLGLTTKTGIDLPTSDRPLKLNVKAFGHNPPAIFEGDRAQLGIGQGIMAVTPLQMCLIASLVANKGWEPTPRVVQSVTDVRTGRATVVPPSKRLRVDLPDWVWSDLWSAMREVTETGTARVAKLPFGVAGKTGSAEENKNKPPHSWFIAFAPTTTKPQVAVCVMVEHGGHGGDVAAPIAAEWLTRWMQRQAHSSDSAASAPVEVSSAPESPAN